MIKIFILYFFILKILCETTIEVDKIFTSNGTENLTFFYNKSIETTNVILFQTEYNITDFNIVISENKECEIKIIESKKSNNYLIFYSMQNNNVNVKIQIINQNNRQYNLTLSRFTNIVNTEKNITFNCTSNSTLMYNLRNLSEFDYILAFTNFPHHLFYYNEVTKEITQTLNNLFLSFQLNKNDNIYLIAFPENSKDTIYFEIAFFNSSNYTIKINEITKEKDKNNEIKFDLTEKNMIYYFFNSFITSDIKKEQYLDISVTYGSPKIYYNNVSNQTSISNILTNKYNLTASDIKSNSYYDIFQIICNEPCFFYIYYIDNDDIIKDKYITFFDIKEGNHRNLTFSDELFVPGFYYNIIILNKNLEKKITLQLNEKEYNITNEKEKEIIIKHEFYEKELKITSINGNIYGKIFVFYKNENISNMELKNGENKKFSNEMTLYIKINNKTYAPNFFREINIINMDEDKNISFCYTLQNDINIFFKPSKFICYDDKYISLIYNQNFFVFDGTLYYFFHSEKGNYTYNYFIVSNFSLEENNLTKINFELKKSFIKMIDDKILFENNKYFFLQILKSDESSFINYRIFKNDSKTIEENNFYKQYTLDNNNTKENNIEITGKCFFQYIILNEPKNITFPKFLNFSILNDTESYINLSFEEFLENEKINYTFLIEKKGENGFEDLKTPFSVFYLLYNEKYIENKNYHLLKLSYKKENKTLYSTIQIPELIKNEYLSEYYLNIIAQENDTKLYFTYNSIIWKVNKVPELRNDKPIDFILRNNYQNLYLYTNTTINQGEEGFFMIKLNTTNNSIHLSFSCYYYDSPNSIDKNILYRHNKSNPRCVDFMFDDPSVIFIRYDFNIKYHTLVLMIYTNQKEIESNNLALKIYNVNKPIFLNNFNQSINITNLSLPIIYKIDIKNFTKNQMSLLSLVNKKNILKVFLGKVIGNGYLISKYYSTEIFGFDQSQGNKVEYQYFNFFFFNFNNNQNISNEENITFELRFINSSIYNIHFQNYSNNHNSENYLINCNGKTHYIIRYNYDKESQNKFILYPKMLYGNGEIYYNNLNFISSIDELLNNNTNNNTNNIKNIPMETSYKYSFFKIICNNNAYTYISQYIPNEKNKSLKKGDLVFISLSEFNDSFSYNTSNIQNENVKVQLYSNISDDFLINDEIFKKNNKIQFFNIYSNNTILIKRKNNNVSKDKILLSILIPLSESELLNETFKNDDYQENTQLSKKFYLINLKSPKSKSLLSHYRFALINSKKEKKELTLKDINYNLEIANYPYISSPLDISNIDEFVKKYNNKIFLKIFTKEMNDENQNFFFIIQKFDDSKIINITVSHSNEYYPNNNELIRLSSQNEGEISLIHQSIFIKLKNLHFLHFQIFRCKKQNTDNNYDLYFSLKDYDKKEYKFNDKIEDSFLIYNGYGEFDIYGDAIFKHSIFLYKSLKNENQNQLNNNFEIKVEMHLTYIEIRIPIESYAYSYYFYIFIAENNTENYEIFDDPCDLIEIVSFNKSVNFFHDTIFEITNYEIDKKEYIYKKYNLSNQNNLIIRVLRNDSTIYGELEFSQISFYIINKNYNTLIILIFLIVIIIIFIFIIYYIKYKIKEKSEDKIIIIKQINNEFGDEDEMNRSIL